MIRKISIQNFRGFTKNFEFSKVNELQGINGTGKSTIKEAICFALMGTDSYGTKAPVHLISEGQDKAQVIITTDKADISRTINRKSKSGTLKLTRDGLTHNLTQKDLNTMLAELDTFLSVFVPGFFMGYSMDSKKRLSVLTSLLPKIDRFELLKKHIPEIYEYEKPWLENLNIFKPAAIAKTFTEKRIFFSKQKDFNAGQISQLQKISIVDAPTKPEKVTWLEEVRPVFGVWNAYAGIFSAYERELNEYNTDLKSSKDLDQNIAFLTKQNSDIMIQISHEEGKKIGLQSDTKVINALDYRLLISDEQTKLEAIPPKPIVITYSENPSCPTCLQDVTEESKSRIEQANANNKSNWEQEYNRVTEHNNRINEGIHAFKKLQETQSNDIGFNKDIENKIGICQYNINGLKARLKSIPEREVFNRDAPMEPPRPDTEKPSNESVKEALEIERDYLGKVAVYKNSIEEAEGSAAKILDLEKGQVLLEQSIARCAEFERVLKSMPQMELEILSGHLAMKDFVINVDKDISVTTKEGFPIEMLSNGQYMKACNELSLKLNSLMKRPLNMIFIDNAEGIYNLNWNSLIEGRDGLQVFFALVGAGNPDGMVVRSYV